MGGAAENIFSSRSCSPSVMIESQTFFYPTEATKCELSNQQKKMCKLAYTDSAGICLDQPFHFQNINWGWKKYQNEQAHNLAKMQPTFVVLPVRINLVSFAKHTKEANYK